MKKYKWYYFLDVSTTRTGVTLLRNDYKKVIVTDLDFSKFKSDKEKSKAQNQVAKFKYIKHFLDDFLLKYPSEWTIYVEGIFVQPNFLHSSEVLLKFHGFLIAYFIDFDIEYFPPKTIRKAISGNGNASKEEIRDMLGKMYEIDFDNFDESDSFAVFEYFRKTNDIDLKNAKIAIK